MKTNSDNKLPKGLFRRKSSVNLYYQFVVAGDRYKGSCQTDNVGKAEKFMEKVKADAIGQKDVGKAVKKEVVKHYTRQIHDRKVKLSESWKAFMKDRSESDTTKYQSKWYADFVGYITNKHPSITYLHEVTAEEAQEYAAYIAEHGAYVRVVSYTRGGKAVSYILKGKLAPRTLKGYIECASMVFNDLAEQASIDANPFDDVDKPKNAKSIPREVFTDDEIDAMLKVSDEFTKPLLLFGINSGLREGDICNMQWKNIDLTNRAIVGLDLRKTGKAIHIPIVNGLYKFLTELKRGESEYLFPHLQEMYSTNSDGVSYRFKKMMDKAGIKKTVKEFDDRRNVSIKDAHALRHTFQYLAMTRYHIPLNVIQSIVGHMSPAMTQRYTDHASLEDKKRFMAAMDKRRTDPRKLLLKLLEREDLNLFRKRLQILTQAL